VATIRVVVVPHDGPVRLAELSEGNLLAELQGLVGGYVERVRLTPTLDMLVNEEGRLLRLPANALATRMVGAAILGDVVLLGNDGGEEWVSLSDTDVAYVEREYLDGVKVSGSNAS